ncbi:hypothetical protein B0H21DRAFT_758128 [Amylocystis lapponica]|nr:hypothetical protein B0H21DRAFT_758128 [Amylocystis lapponica]
MTSDNVKQPESDLGQLASYELFWRDHQPWLQEKGYMLRARYKPDWKPSWVGSKKPWYNAEDLLSMPFPIILDATRISDGKMVTLKKVSKSQHPFEAEIGQFLSTEPLSSDPHNHCVPIYEILQCPDDEDTILLVMPILRQYNSPRLQTVGEAVDFFHQLFEGLKFMHDQHVAHRDCMSLNVMVDPSSMYPKMYHPTAGLRTLDYKGTAKYYSRTERPSKYYYVDFGHALKFDPADGPPVQVPLFGGDKSVPEFQGEGAREPGDPFPVDVYYLGNLIREDWLKIYAGFEFIKPLVEAMVQDDPHKRPTIDQVVTQFDDILRGISPLKLRKRLAQKQDSIMKRVILDIFHVFRTASYVVRRLPAIPDYTHSRRSS